MSEPESRGELCNPAARRIERWIELAELAAKEPNPAKLLTLLKELNTLLAKEKWLISILTDEPGSNGSDGNSQD